MVPSERTVTVGVGHGKKAARFIDAYLRGDEAVRPPGNELAGFGTAVRLGRGAGAGRLRLRRPAAAFGHAYRGGFEVTEDLDEPPRYAFLGVRPCDLRAIEIRDRVLGQPGSRYARRRADAFVIAVNCTEPGETCFCASMGTGPGAGRDGLLAIKEL